MTELLITGQTIRTVICHSCRGFVIRPIKLRLLFVPLILRWDQ